MVHHISHQLPQVSRPNKGYTHKCEDPLQLLLNLQDHTTTSHKVIPRYITPKLKKSANSTVRGKFTTYFTNHQSYPGQKWLQTPAVGGSSLTSIKLITPYSHSSQQSYSHSYFPQSE